MKITKFEDLEIWKISLKITKDIYTISAKQEFCRDFGLRDQIRRAVISISSNIVEGFEKNNNNELIRFLKISKGSAGEVRNHLYIALAVKYISQSEFEIINKEIENLASQIGGFIVYLQKKRSEKEFLRK